MPKLKRLLVSACFETAQRRRQCSRNKGHEISKGDRCSGHQGEYGQEQLLHGMRTVDFGKGQGRHQWTIP